MLAEDENDPRAQRMNSAGRLAHREWVEEVFADRLARGIRRALPIDRRPRRRHRRLRLEVSAARPRAVRRRCPRPDAVDDRSDSWPQRISRRRPGRRDEDSLRHRGRRRQHPAAVGGRASASGPRRRRSSVLGHRGIRERVEAAGLAFEPFTGGRHFDPTVQRSLPAIMAAFTRVAADRRLGQCVVEAARRHDVDAVVVDMILTAGIPEIVDSGIPTIVFVHCFYRAVQDLAASPVGWMLRLRGTDPLAPEHLGLLQVVSARADLDPMRGDPAVCHTGVVWQGVPSAAEPAAGAANPGQPQHLCLRRAAPDAPEHPRRDRAACRSRRP